VGDRKKGDKAPPRPPLAAPQLEDFEPEALAEAAALIGQEVRRREEGRG
jgi:hypothetical protein